VTDDLSGDAGGGFQPTTYAPSSATKENVDMLLDVELDVSIELGKSNLSIKRILELAPGSIVELDRMAGEPVDLLVNNKVVAKGEVVVVDESFGIRILSLVSPEERIKSLR
jgi:flagellar motor switch protein FliN/FliY